MTDTVSTSEQGSQTITVLGYDDGQAGSREDRDGDDRGDRGFRDVLKRREVPVDDLQQAMVSFVEKMKEVIGVVPDELGRYALDTVTLRLEVSATGKVNLIGAGGEVSGTGGIELTLKRR